MTDDGPAAGELTLSDIEVISSNQPEQAAESLRKLLRGDPLNAAAYRLLAKILSEIDRRANISGELKTVVRSADPLLDRAAAALNKNDLETAEIILRRRLLERPADSQALHLMASLAHALDFDAEAEDLFNLAIETSPSSLPARFAFAAVLDRQNRNLEVVALMNEVLAMEPFHPLAKAIKASALGRAGQFDECLSLYEDLLKQMPDEPSIRLSYGLMLTTMGRSEEGRRAMRATVEQHPQSGEAWWNLSNLKTERLGPADIATMTAALASGQVTHSDRLHLHFALGKAFEDAGDAEHAFAHYAEANAIRRQELSHNPDDVTREVTANRRFFTSAFFKQRAGQGCRAADPIFIVGMPRSGSTLIEQILASHPDVEGTTELPDIGAIAKRLGRRHGDYFGKLSGLSADECRELGEEYLERTRAHRVEGRARFIDKMPNNWVHVPLIHMILPNAKIVDARRHPLACCFSNFKQHFARGQAFSYDLGWMGRYYADYVRMMAHVDDVLPGSVHRLIHEKLVDDTEAEIRSLLEYLDLPFDEACLRFYENRRAVRTPSSQQVRRPISREGMESWRAFEPWLGPLKEALGPVLDAYPEVPDFPN